MAEAREQQRRLAAAAASGGRAGDAGGGAAANGAPPNGAASNGAHAEEGHAGEGLCVVCFAHECDTVFPACGHMCACSACAPALARCPICRARGSCIRVYRT